MEKGQRVRVLKDNADGSYFLDKEIVIYNGEIGKLNMLRFHRVGETDTQVLSECNYELLTDNNTEELNKIDLDFIRAEYESKIKVLEGYAVNDKIALESAEDAISILETAIDEREANESKLMDEITQLKLDIVDLEEDTEILKEEESDARDINDSFHNEVITLREENKGLIDLNMKLAGKLDDAVQAIVKMAGKL